MRAVLNFFAVSLAITLVASSLGGCVFFNKGEALESGADTNKTSNNSEEISAEVTDFQPPVNEDLNIITDGQSEYVIVYDSKVEAFETAGFELSKYINGQFGVSLAVYSDQNAPSSATKRIIIGEIDNNAKYVKSKLNASNDFAVDVCGDDLVLCAANEYLYDYLFEIAQSEFFTKSSGQTELVISKDGGFIYHQSAYAEFNYAQYLRNNGVTIGFMDLTEMFYARTYTAKDGTKIPYRIYIPSDYDPNNQTTPVLLFLHGAGERGNDNQMQLYNFIPDIFSMKNSPYAEAIIIAPQCPAGQQWVDTSWSRGSYSINNVKESNELAAVVELIGEIEREYRPDVNRYYVAGLSMGGFGTWDIVMRHPDLFAAAMPICGGGDPTQAENIKNIPIWTFHGTADSSVPYSGTEEMSEALQQAGSEVFKFTPFQGYSHSIWSNVGCNRAYANWLFQQVKSAK